MKRALNLTAIALIAASFPPCIGKPQNDDSQPGLPLVVEVYNFSKAPASTVSRSEKEAGRILRRAGIDVAWLHCPTTPEEAQTAPVCQDKNLMKLTLRIMPTAPSRSSRSALGMALSVPRSGDYITIFYSRIQEMARCKVASEQDLMGLAMAHEIGHLLLTVSEHSATGLMRGQWREAELKLAAENRLRFSPEQASRMREEVARRARLVSVVETAQ